MLLLSFQSLIAEELWLRQQAELAILQQDAQVKSLIEQHCEVVPGGAISREQWQNFCFQQVSGKDCQANIPFKTYLNRFMPELGYPLGYIHTKVRVYRGLKWKVK